MSVERRADRLGVALFMFGLVNQPPREAIAATWPMLTLDAIELFRDLDEEDIALANVCLEAEAELRAREWQALEAFDALMTGTPDAELPAQEKRELAGAILTLGWQWFPGEED